jgi:hypothetical protein
MEATMETQDLRAEMERLLDLANRATFNGQIWTARYYMQRMMDLADGKKS